MDHYGKVYRKINPRENANIFSIFTFFYTGGLFRKSLKRDLEDEDIYEVVNTCKSKTAANNFEKLWIKQKKTQQKSCLVPLVWQGFGMRFIILCLINLVVKITISIYEPEFISKLVYYFTPNSTLSYKDAIFYAVFLIGLRFLNAFYIENYQIYLQHLAINIRNSLCSLVYRKSLRLSPNGISEIGLGNVITVITKDIVFFEKSIFICTDAVVDIIKSFVVCYLIYKKLGISSFIGIGLLLSILPLQAYVGKCIKNLRLIIGKKTDERLQTTQETLSAIKIIKMLTWEWVFVKKVEEKRRKELQYLLKAAYLGSAIIMLGFFTSKLGLYSLMMAYIRFAANPSAEDIFYVMRAFGDLKHTIGVMIPLGLGNIAAMIASTQRINRILNADEISANTPKVDESLPAVAKIADVTVKMKEKEILKNINMEIKPGLTVITGALGSGKSTLLKVFLKDVPIFSGKILSTAKYSYCSQDSWLFPSSIKQNIIFGELFDAQRYKKVCEICALDYDFNNLFDNGDETIVADGGKNLSGGQQARINLARAIYRKSDIYLLDDPLHALDPHVQEYIYQHCIKEFLKMEKCVLVTHNLRHKNTADYLILLQDGRIKFNGKSDEVKAEELIEEIAEIDEKLSKKERIDDDTEIHDNNESAKLIKDVEKVKVYSELKQIGKVELSVFKKYFQAGGFSLFLLVLFFFIIAEGSDSYSARVLTNWVNLRQNITEIELFSNNSQNSSSIIEELSDRAEWTIKLYAAMALFSFINDFINQYILLVFARRASMNLHNKMIESLTRASMRFFDFNFIGNILNRFSQDLAIVDEVLPEDMNFFIMVFFGTFGAISLVATVRTVFIIPSLGLIIFLYILRMIYMPAARSLKRLEAATRSPLIGHLNASIEGLTTIRASNVEHLLAEEFDQHQDLYTSARYMTFCTTKAFAFFMHISSTLYVSFVVIKLLLEEDTEELSGNVGLAITKASTVAMIIQFALAKWSELENDMVQVERVLEYTEIKQDLYEGKTYENWPSNGKIRFTDVSLAYRLKEKVLNNISFNVESNQKIGIVGRTGAGKSSIISVLFRLYNYDGFILIDDVDIKTLSLDVLRDRISIIPQDPILFRGNIRDNIDPLHRYSDEEIWISLKKVHMSEMISSLELIIDQTNSFSTGQRQLICIARAIIKKNKIVVLDEATANMDLETDFLIQQAITENFTDCTVLIIAHRLQSVLKCNKILVMDRGSVLEYADPADLVANKRSHFWRMLSLDSNCSSSISE